MVCPPPLFFLFLSPFPLSSPPSPPLHRELTATTRYPQSVDDVSAGLSSLGITTTNENSQPVPVTHAPPPESSGHERPDSTTTFLDLPWLVKWHIYTHLPSRDCVVLSRTCRHMYSFNTLAYTHLQFLPPNSLFALAQSIYQLATVLACSPHYAAAVRTACIVGWNTTGIPEGCGHEAVHNALDTGMRVLLENAPHLYSFTLDLNRTGAVHYFPQTFTRLTRVRTIRDLRLATFLVPTYIPMGNDPPLEHLLGEVAPALERVWLSVCSGGWLPLVMRDPRHLRWFGLTVLDKTWRPADADFAATLHRVAEAATELETLVLNKGRHFDAAALGQILQFGFVRLSISASPLRWLMMACHDHLTGSRGSRAAALIFDQHGGTQSIKPKAALLRLLSFFCHALENRRQSLRDMAP
jgi:hypothetical protein